MTPNLQNRNEQIPELQIARALAMLGVLSVHASASATISMLKSGYYSLYNFINVFMKFGTPTFILLSSFLLFYSYYTRPLDTKLMTSFYKKRLLYIIIPYFIFSALYFVLVQLIQHEPIFSLGALASFSKKLLLGKAFSHLYFIFISIQFYLLFPAILWLAKKKAALVPWFIPMGFALQWAFVLFNKYYFQVPNKGNWSFSYFSFFFLGAAMGIYFPKIKAWLMISKQNVTLYRLSAWAIIWIAWLAFALSHVLINYNARLLGTRYNSLLYEFLWSFHTVLSALALVQASFIIYRFLPGIVSKTFYRLGQLSFGIYLIHLFYLFVYDRYIPSFGISWLSHFRYLGSWIFMLGASWLTVELASRLNPYASFVFGRLPERKENKRILTGKMIALGSAALLLVFAAVFGIWQKKSDDTSNPSRRQQLLSVQSETNLSGNYDVIVVGTEPEGVVAAVSAARNGLKTLLVDGKNREILGGLMTVGGLNTLDLNYSPKNKTSLGKHIFLNKGIFQEWYDKIEGTSFDTHTAANAFYEMVANEPNIDLLMKTRKMAPIIHTQTNGNKAVTGLHVVLEDGNEREIQANSVIDATQDGDIAAAAGAPYTIGREDLGDPNAQMAVTLVFKLSGVTQQLWDSFAKHKNTGIDKMSAWGFPEAKEYVSSNPERVRIRGLNIGRQNDNTILINAMHIFKVDPLDPESVAEALEIGKQEAPRIAAYLKKEFREFKNLEFAGTADELYVRETRHFEGEYRLTAADLLDNRDHWDAIAYGSYKLDIQSTNYKDNGIIIMAPIQYGVPFRSLVPKEVDGMLIVGRSASFDSLPHGSARAIPLGMATAEAAGAAAKLAAENKISFRELSQSRDLISTLRERLTAQGMDLSMNDFEAPAYKSHKAYKGLIAAVSMLLTSGSVDNKSFELDAPSNAQRFVNNMNNVKNRHPAFFTGKSVAAIDGMSNPSAMPLTLEQAFKTIAHTIDNENAAELRSSEIISRGWIQPETIDAIANPAKVTNGEAFMLIRDLMEYYANIVYE
ncbi:FAD-dependent oxidoreductase [Paenibacillus sp. FJAT-27812]|uniref:FAD-dependent oxidoreductase n=1 Tax=Paenibacillus sp. FJAT-27812 TaxID=1684143 RepID=UPI000A93F7A3